MPGLLIHQNTKSEYNFGYTFKENKNVTILNIKLSSDVRIFTLLVVKAATQLLLLNLL